MLRAIKMVCNKLCSYFDISIHWDIVKRPNSLVSITTEGHYNLFIYLQGRSLIWSIPRGNKHEDNIQATESH